MAMPKIRSDCRLMEFPEAPWRGRYCWDDKHVVCPVGLSKPGFSQRHPYLALQIVAALALTSMGLAIAARIWFATEGSGR